MTEKKLLEVTVKVPEGLMRFLKDIIPASTYDNIDEYLTDAIISRVYGDIDASVFYPTIKAVAERYDLKEEFEVKD
jgi:TRAP-type uncharacterized transport system substrate-binding protein